MKTLFVVSGGDAPGVNTAIARYTMIAQRRGDQVLGAYRGFAGVLADDLHVIDPRLARMLAGRGGSSLPSSREPVLAEADARTRLQRVLESHDIDNVLLFGGDGTLRHVLPLLQTWGIHCIALPTTIDNDVPGTDYTLGHDSACSYAYQAVEGLLATAHALPGRIFMLETLGGDTGYLALAVAYGAGAQCVLLPEYEVTLDWLGGRIRQGIDADGYALVVLSEGVSLIPELPDAIPKLTGVRLRYTRLGHAQRGGDVSHRDRWLAMRMSHLAYEGFRSGVTQGVVVVRGGQPVLHEGTLSDAVKDPPDYELYAMINNL